MNEEMIVNEEATEVETDYVAAIQELKDNSVSKDLYHKLKNENSKLLEALVKNKQIESKTTAPTEGISDLRKKLFCDGCESNLEFIDTALKLRNQLIEKGERDPFLPIGNKVTETAEQHDTAQRVADVLQQCVDFAQGDSGIFTAELQRRTMDTPFRRR